MFVVGYILLNYPCYESLKSHMDFHFLPFLFLFFFFKRFHYSSKEVLSLYYGILEVCKLTLGFWSVITINIYYNFSEFVFSYKEFFVHRQVNVFSHAADRVSCACFCKFCAGSSDRKEFVHATLFFKSNWVQSDTCGVKFEEVQNCTFHFSFFTHKL